MQNQRDIVSAVDFFASDNDDRYPESVAKVGFTEKWNWTNPTALVARELAALRQSRSVGASLNAYVEDASKMVCPQAPSKHPYLQEAWEQGDQWDHPDTFLANDALDGNYSLLWNYIGYLSEKKLFRGPRRPSGTRNASKLLVIDYYGFNHYRTPEAYASCERFVGGNVLPESDKHSSAWTTAPDPNEGAPTMPLHAGYTDGHVASFTTNDMVPMRVIKDRVGNIPYADDEPTPGSFYLPRGGF